MSNTRKTITNILSGGAGFLLPMLINFIATPFLLARLDSEAYGLQSLVNVILGYLMIADMGIDIPVTKLLAEYNIKQDRENRNLLLNNTLQMYLIIGAFGSLSLFAAEPFLHSVFHISPELKEEATLVFWITGFGFLGNILCVWGKALFVGLQRYDIANGVYIGFNVIAIVAGIVLVDFGYGVVFFVLAKAAAFFLSAIVYLVIAFRLLPGYRFFPGFNKEMLKKVAALIGYGFLLRMSGMFFSRLDQSLIGTWINVSAVGTYSIPLMLTTAAAGLIGGLVNFTFPRASELFSTDNRAELNRLFIRSSTYATVLACLAFGMLGVIGDRFLTLWINEGFANEVSVPLTILSAAYFINITFCVIVNNYVIAMNGIRTFAVYSVLRGLLMAFGFLILIKPLGLTGAAIGVLLGGMADVIFNVRASLRIIGLSPWEVFQKTLFKPVLLMVPVLAGLYLVKTLVNSWVVLIGVATIASVVYLGLVLSFALTSEEKEYLANLRRRKLSNP